MAWMLRFALLPGSAARLHHQGYDAAAWLQPALTRLRVLPPPAARARIGARLHRTRARRAADAGEAVVVQLVRRQIAALDVGPDSVLGPFQERSHLPHAIALVPRERLTMSTLGRLFAPHTRDPGLVATDGALEGFDLANLAARLPLV